MPQTTSDSIFIKNPLSELLEETLNHFDDTTWLGHNSPFAETYLISPFITNQKVSESQVRGEALQKLIKQTVLLLKERDEVAYNLIQILFLMDKEQDIEELLSSRKKISLEKRANTFNWSRKTFYRYQEKYLTSALDYLGQLLWQQLKPTLRMEVPPPRPVKIWGRNKSIEDSCSERLQQKKSVGLSGMGGVGKSSYGSYLANRLAPSSQIFWFTIRPGFNDQLSTLLFALGHFLQQQLALYQNHSELLAYVTSQVKNEQKKSLDLEIVLGLLRNDVTSLNLILDKSSSSYPIFCFDELDLLQPDQIEAHAPLLKFLGTLTTVNIALIFMGQQLPFEVAWPVELLPLTMTDMQAMFKANDIFFSKKELTDLSQELQGNPRLIELVIMLYKVDQKSNIATLIKQLPNHDLLWFLLERIRCRLSEAEQQLLLELAIFETPPPPQKSWSPEVIGQLKARRLIQIDHEEKEGQLIQLDRPGSLNLLPAFRQALLDHLTPQDKAPLHNKAALAYAEQGLWTLAAIHWIQAGQFDLAINLWHQHRQTEIEQGQGEIALESFKLIPLEQLTDNTTRALGIDIITELHKLVGNYEAAQQALALVKRCHSVVHAHLKRLAGDIAELTGNYRQAGEAYQTGLETVEKLLYEKTIFHKNLAWVYKQNDNLDAAWREAQIAAYEAENMQGHIQIRRGNYQMARIHLNKAIELAKQLNLLENIAKVYDNIGALLVWEREFTEAEFYQTQSLQIYQQIKRKTRQADLQNALAVTYTQSGRAELAIPLLEEALALHTQLNETEGIAYDANTFSEAYLALHEWDKAEEYAILAQSQEDEGIIPNSLRVQGEIRLGQGLINEAKKFFIHALDLVQKQQDQFNEGYIWRGFMKLYILQKQPAEAQQAYQEAIRCFDSLPSPGEVAETEQLWQTLTENSPA